MHFWLYRRCLSKYCLSAILVRALWSMRDCSEMKLSLWNKNILFSAGVYLRRDKQTQLYFLTLKNRPGCCVFTLFFCSCWVFVCPCLFCWEISLVMFRSRAPADGIRPVFCPLAKHALSSDRWRLRCMSKLNISAVANNRCGNRNHNASVVREANSLYKILTPAENVSRLRKVPWCHGIVGGCQRLLFGY